MWEGCNAVRNVLFSHPILPLVLLMLAVVGGLCPVSRRKRMPLALLQGLLALGILAICLVLDLLFVDSSNASTTLEPIMAFAAGLAFSVLVMRTRMKEGIFITVWAQILIELFNQILIPGVHRIANTETVLGIAEYFLVITAAAAFLFFAARFVLFPILTRDGEYRMNGRKVLLALVVLIVFLVLSNYQLIFWLIGNATAKGGLIVPVFRLIVGVAALFVLYLQNALELKYAAQLELDTLHQLQAQREEQYRISRENIALINQKCHDLKHQIAALRSLRDGEAIDRQITEMEHAVMIYDSSVKTGNSALDVVLTEKSLLCEANGINLTCLIDGRSLDFVDVVDLYSMFGNALDNAIESVMKESDVNKRVIQTAGYREQDLFLIRVRNYCEQPPVLIDGVPQTSKQNADYHGFGILSIRTIAQKYGGDITIDVGANYFSLQILLPIPTEA